MVEDKKIDRMEQKQDKQRMKIKRKTENRAAFGGVMDKYTQININKLRAKGVIQEFIGIISAGKEANVYYGIGENEAPIAIKIYKIDPQNTKWMKNYIIGDPRFQKIGTSTHKIIYTWCKKEYKNLKQMGRHEVPVPTPLDYKSNILVMEFIGDANGTPAIRLKNTKGFDDPAYQAQQTFEQIERMYVNAHLVHGDLSEYNILWYQDRQIIIDVSQAVSTYHINAPFFLQRDIQNMVNFYATYLPLEELPNVDGLVHEILQKAAE